MTIFKSAVFLLLLQSVFGLKQTGTCRPVCAGDDCITVTRDRVDFETAEKACRHSGGELLTFQSEADKQTFDILSGELFGSFWIGLRLPAGSCSNLSAPLRGYEPTSGNADWTFAPSLDSWRQSAKLCSPRCVSLSNHHEWTERPCTDQTDGFLCRSTHKDACRAEELSDPTIIRGTETCKSAPCEHTCTDVKGGYVCSCFKGYIPDSEKPNMCKLHCAQDKCPAVCEGNNACPCPDGYIINGEMCEDINECVMDTCEGGCKNTFGGFVCYCKEGFVLKDQVKCTKPGNSDFLPIPTPVAVKPAASNNTVKGSSVAGGAFLWVWVTLAVAAVVAVFVIRLFVVKRQRRREQNSAQQPADPADHMEC
ncbi:endosialin-like [Odontesthes bonariensis]|uniref:endosialin-like n=1 Tax=Odontesthes bonariensis TaxID=219752 RepID=UPI003F583407